MTTVEDIEKAVAKLNAEQLARFRAWFEEYQAQLFDERIERDAKAGTGSSPQRVQIIRQDAVRSSRRFLDAPLQGSRLPATL
jgi:hypothetical protein